MKDEDRAHTGEETGNWPVIRRLLDLTWRYRLACIRMIVFHFVLLGLTVLSLGMTGRGIDYIRHAISVSEGRVPPPSWPFGLAPPAHWPPMAVLFLLGGIIVLLALIRSVVTYLNNLNSVRLTQQGLVVDLRAAVYDKLQRLSFRFFDDKASGTLITRVTSDVQNVRLFVDGVVVQTFIFSASALTYFWYMFRIHRGLTLLSLTVWPFIALGSSVFSRKVKKAYRKNRDLTDEMILGVSEQIQGMYVTKGFSREADAEARFAARNAAVRNQKFLIFQFVTIYGPSMELLTRLTVLGVLAYGGWLTFHGQLPLGEGLIVFLGLLQRLTDQVNVLTTITDSVQQSLTSARRLFEILDMEPEVRSPPQPVRRRLGGKIRFEHVSFCYTPGALVLEDIHFEVQPGECIGILGGTGAGKSTLLSLIPRFYDVTGGCVFLDDVDVRRLDLDALRRQVGFVFQESFLFSNTVAANIAFGRPEATRGDIERAARLACAHEFIQAMPQGYDTVLYEGGGNLSGGQRQRLALARAILLEPPILLLDDPTAAVDAETEHEILEAIESARAGRTTFLVTHRMHALGRMDRILVLHRGRQVQWGTHEELMAVRGPYRRAARIQLGDMLDVSAGLGGSAA